MRLVNIDWKVIIITCAGKVETTNLQKALRLPARMSSN